MAEKKITTYRDRLTSLTKHLRKYEKPFPHGYDIFATTYIPGAIPWTKIVSDETGSYTAEILPFPTDFEIEKLTLQEKERKLRGESVRKQDLSQSPDDTTGHHKACSHSQEVQLAHLYFRAMQHCEVNKARALDEKYPKPDSNVVRSTYSKEHQAAVAETVKKGGWKKQHRSSSETEIVEAPFQQFGRPLVTFPQIASISERNRARATESEQEVLCKLRLLISETLGKPSPIRELQVSREPWQFQAKSDRPRLQPPKKRKLPWKKNVYPPKSKEERIAELRKMAPPLRSEHWQTDHLPGLWEPEIMIETFKTISQEKLQNEERDMYTTEQDWWTMFYANRKCLEWLKSIPDSL